MATRKISAMSTGTTAIASDKIPIERSGSNLYITPTMLGAYINPMTTAGDLIKGGTSGALGRLGIGTNGHVLTVVSGAPAWAAAAGGSSTGLLARARLSGVQNITASSFIRANFDSVDYDPGSDITTGASWVYTTPATAWYQVNLAYMLFIANGTAWSNGQYVETDVFVNGSSVGMISSRNTYAADGTGQWYQLDGAIAVSCTAGDTIDVRVWHNTGATRRLEADSAIEIYRVS